MAVSVPTVPFTYYVDSTDLNEDGRLILAPGIAGVVKVQPKFFVFPITYHNLEGKRVYLSEDAGVTWASAALTDGNYDIYELLTAVQTALNALTTHAAVYACTLNPITNSVVITQTSSTVQFRLDFRPATSLYTELGFTGGAVASSVAFVLSGTKYPILAPGTLVMRSSLAEVPHYSVSRGSKRDYQDVLFTVPVVGISGDRVTQEIWEPAITFSAPTYLNEMVFKLCRPGVLTPIDLRGDVWRLGLEITRLI